MRDNAVETCGVFFFFSFSTRLWRVAWLVLGMALLHFDLLFHLDSLGFVSWAVYSYMTQQARNVACEARSRQV